MGLFDTILVRKPKRTTFDLTHDVKLTCDFGKLVPFLCEEVVPGDTWYNKSDVLVRFSPLIAPVMHRMWVTTHFFYVPFRLLWNKYEDWETGGADGLQQPPFPQIMMHGSSTDTAGQWSRGSLADYLNYPTSDSNVVDLQTGGTPVSVLPFRAYQMIYNEYYRDENQQEEFEFKKGSDLLSSGSEYDEMLKLRNRAWRKDYFTSALPWPQKGKQQSVPIFGTGKVTDSEIGIKNLSKPSRVVDNSGSGTSDMYVDSSGYVKARSNPSAFQSALLDNSDNLTIENSQISFADAGITIQELRRSARIQKLYEAKARGGSRLKEFLLSVFGVDNDDLRLFRPQFLGGGSTPVNITDVVQTSQTTNDSPQGQYAGLGYSFGSSNSFKNTFKERGYVLGIMSIMPECGYTEGLPRGYMKTDPLDFALPQLADLGEQEIYNYEVAMRKPEDGVKLTDTWGYAPRYAEYKYIPNRVHGEFKNMNSYGYWTLNRYYENFPTLSEEFIQCDAKANDLNRIFAVEDDATPKMLCQIVNHTKARRPMPYLPIPTL